MSVLAPTPPRQRRIPTPGSSRKGRFRSFRAGFCACLLLGLGLALVQPATAQTNTRPRLSPDYFEVVIPPNLAPLNFTIEEAGAEYRVRVAGLNGTPLALQQAEPGIRFPLAAWKELLRNNRGRALRWEISVSDAAGQWAAFAPFETPVAREDIDPYLFYRRFQPLYSTYKHMGIYQRHLESFDEKPVLRNDQIDHGCVNCHTPHQGSTDLFAVSFRGRFGTPTLLLESNRISRINFKLGYLAWHPGGKLLAFATNAITQFFHLAGPLNRDTYDGESGINVYHRDSGKVESPAALDAPGQNENWPAWGPDGRHLYYASGPKLDFKEIGKLRCDIVRVSYNPEDGSWGKPEVLFRGEEQQLSANQPRVSPDNRYLVFTGSNFGSFPLFYPESDLFLMELATRRVERLAISTPFADTYHSWSSNGRWMVFCSRGMDGVFARPMLTYFDGAGHFSKPLLVPQEDPQYYQTCLHNFNVPELGRGPVGVTEDAIVEALARGANPGTPPGAGPDKAPVYSRE